MKVNRYYLEINSLKNLNQVISPDQNLILEKVDPPDIKLNKFFYKNVGKNHRWVDRLVWDNLKWMSYLENKNVHTYILKLNEDLVGYFEIIQDFSTNSSEIAYFGILDDYIGKKFGGPSVLVVRAAVAVDVATAVIGLASVDAVPATPRIVIPPREVVPSHSVNVVVDGTVWTIQLEPVVGVVP